MITLDIEQGSEEWHKARLGIPTASQFGRILTVKSMKPSAQSEGYMHELLAEYVLGEPAENFNSSFMQRGSIQENEAVKYYEMQKDLDTQKAGFCLTDCKRIGCSPDRLVGLNGGLEIKTPSAKNHMAFLLGANVNDYKAQIQGCMYVCEREWWDLVAFNPVMPPIIVRFYRDKNFIECLNAYLLLFLEEMRKAKEKLAKLNIAEYKEPKIEGLEWLEDD